MSIEAMKQALEAMIYFAEEGGYTLNALGKIDAAIPALRTAIEQAEKQEPVALHAMAKRRVFDAIRGAYDLGYSDARNARTTPGDSAPGYKGRDVEADHGGALISALERYTTPPAAPVQETPFQIGQRLRQEGKGISDLWGAVRSDADMPEAHRGFDSAAPVQDVLSKKNGGEMCEP